MRFKSSLVRIKGDMDWQLSADKGRHGLAAAAEEEAAYKLIRKQRMTNTNVALCIIVYVYRHFYRVMLLQRVAYVAAILFVCLLSCLTYS